MATRKIRIVLADDHALIRSGIATLLHGSVDIEVVGEASDGEEAIERVKDLHPDVLVIDLSMPKLSGLDAIKIITKRFPTTRVIVLTMHENEEYVYQILRSGAGGYVLKSAGKDELSSAIRAVAGGEKFFSPRVSQIMADGFVRRAEGDTQQPGVEVPLTKREREIIVLVSQGLTNQQIASRLYISPRTVDTHRTNIMQKLDIHDLANLVRYAIDHGLLAAGDERSRNSNI